MNSQYIQLIQNLPLKEPIPGTRRGRLVAAIFASVVGLACIALLELVVLACVAIFSSVLNRA